MAKNAYIGDENGKARRIANIYIGLDGKARKIKQAYIGDANGKARLFFASCTLVAGCTSDSGCSCVSDSSCSCNDYIGCSCDDYTGCACETYSCSCNSQYECGSHNGCSGNYCENVTNCLAFWGEDACVCNAY